MPEEELPLPYSSKGSGAESDWPPLAFAVISVVAAVGILVVIGVAVLLLIHAVILLAHPSQIVHIAHTRIVAHGIDEYARKGQKRAPPRRILHTALPNKCGKKP